MPAGLSGFLELCVPILDARRQRKPEQHQDPCEQGRRVWDRNVVFLFLLFEQIVPFFEVSVPFTSLRSLAQDRATSSGERSCSAKTKGLALNHKGLSAPSSAQPVFPAPEAHLSLGSTNHRWGARAGGVGPEQDSVAPRPGGTWAAFWNSSQCDLSLDPLVDNGLP